MNDFYKKMAERFHVLPDKSKIDHVWEYISDKKNLSQKMILRVHYVISEDGNRGRFNDDSYEAMADWVGLDPKDEKELANAMKLLKMIKPFDSMNEEMAYILKEYLKRKNNI